MKNLNIFSLVMTILTFSSILSKQILAQSVWINPLSWDEKVNDAAANAPTKDTLLVESFDEDELSMLDYSVTKGKYDFFYPADEGIKGASASKSIRIYPGTTLEINIDKSIFDPFSGSWEVIMNYAVQKVNKADVLNSTIEYEASTTPWSEKVLTPSANGISYGFSDKKGSSGLSFFKFRKIKTTKIKLDVAKTASSSSTGYYCIDNLMVRLDLPLYTKLNQEGDWNDYKNWSHLIPQGKRNALVKGYVSVDKQASCNQLITFQPNIQVTGKGKLNVNQFTVIYPFESKGKWFFVSFPFDVYKGGIDERFILGDESTVTTGGVNNILYVMEYDSHYRSTNTQNASEWKCIDLQNMTDDKPVLYKGKGYLMALDETADIQELCFSSPEKTKMSYVSESSLPILADELQGGKADDNGWVLCGNPYPSSLSLQDILPNADLDGNIYVYDGSKYQPYEIGSLYQLPPFSAFFVKAKRTTELTMLQKEHTDEQLLRSAGMPCSSRADGPQVTATEKIVSPLRYRLMDGKIEIPELKGDGRLVVYDLFGKKIQQNRLIGGYNLITLPLAKGIYIIQIETEKEIERIKYKHRRD